jgi:hypothetical protein
MSGVRVGSCPANWHLRQSHADAEALQCLFAISYMQLYLVIEPSPLEAFKDQVFQFVVKFECVKVAVFRQA